MSDTPETDAAWEELCCTDLSWYRIAEKMKAYCQEKERERDEALKALKEHEEGKPTAIVHRAFYKTVVRERDEAREQSAKFRDIAEWAVDNIFHKCTEDLIRAELEELKQLK